MQQTVKAAVGKPRSFAPAKADEIELSIVIPCLNEAETLSHVVDRAQRFLAAYSVRGEILVADNG